jgi:hypothetical protein
MSTTMSPTFVRTPGGSTDGAGHATDTQLYVISTHKVRARDGKPPFRWVPYGVEHAWQPGSRRTLCGQWTSGWTVFWERPFSATPTTACQECIEASLPAASRRRLDPPKSNVA